MPESIQYGNETGLNSLSHIIAPWSFQLIPRKSSYMEGADEGGPRDAKENKQLL